MPYSYVMYGYAGYAKHGYVTWLCHCGHVGYAKCGYPTWLRHIWGARRGVKNYEKNIYKNLFHLHFSKFTDMLTQQCFFFLHNLKCVIDLCTLNHVYLRSNHLVRPTIKFTTLWSAVSVLESNVR